MISVNWTLDRSKYLALPEAKQLLESARKLADRAFIFDHKVPVRDYLIVHLALATGLRVMEISQLNCGDISADENYFSVYVRKGKGGKKRLVHFNSKFKEHFEQYLNWKKTIGEPSGPDDPLLLSSNTGRSLTTRAIEKAFKRTAARAGLPSYYSIHCLRHTYACQLYRVSNHDLRMVQKQLGHSKSKTTEVYADVMDDDLARSLEKLYL